MRRREFLGIAAMTVAGLTRSAAGQSKASLPVIGFLIPVRQDSDLARARMAALRKGLIDEGLVEGTNYSLAMRFLGGDFSRIEPFVQELGSLKPHVMVIGSMGVTATRKFYPNLPIVFTAVAVDPIATGLGQSYAHPGGMSTGNVMNAVGGEETMAQKRLGFFRALMPDLKRLGIIGPANGILLIKEKEALQKVASQAGFDILSYEIKTPDDLESAFAAALKDEVNAFYISGEPLLFSNMAKVMTFVTATGKPSFGPYPEWGRAGLLMSYSTDPLEGYRNAGIYAAKIVKGAKPGDLPILQASKFVLVILPILQASKFVLVINQKTARSLGIARASNYSGARRRGH